VRRRGGRASPGARRQALAEQRPNSEIPEPSAIVVHHPDAKYFALLRTGGTVEAPAPEPVAS